MNKINNDLKTNNLNILVKMITISIFIISLYTTSIKYLNMNSLYFYGLIVMILIITSIKKDIYIKLNLISIFWIIFSCIIIISTIKSNLYTSYNFLLYYLIAMCIICFFPYNDNIENIIINVNKVVSIIFVVITIFSAIFKNFYLQYIIPLLVDSQKSIVLELYNYNLYSGIAGQTGNNAFLISISIGIIACTLIIKKEKKYRNIILFLLSIIALFFTGKRGLLICNIVALFILAYFFILKGRRNGLIKLILFIISIIIMVLIIVNIIPGTKLVFERLINDDNLTGRENLYNMAISIIKTRPLFGIGVNTFKYISGGLDVHNVFLQIMCETGIIGLIFFVLSIISIYIKTIIKMNNKVCNGKYYFACSFYVQTIFIIYCMSGNPFYDYNMFFLYCIFVTLILKDKKFIKKGE